MPTSGSADLPPTSNVIPAQAGIHASIVGQPLLSLSVGPLTTHD